MRSIFQVISLFLVFFAFAKLPAQPGFNATYDLGKSGSQFYASIIEKDTIIAFGEIVLDQFQTRKSIVVAKLDTLGKLLQLDTLKDMIFYNPDKDYYHCFPKNYSKPIRLKNKMGYAIPVNIYNFGIITIDNNLNITKIYQKVSNFGGPEGVTNIVELNDGFLAFGYNAYADNFNGRSIYALKFGNDGQVKWYKDYLAKDGFYQDLTSFNQIAANRIVIGATTYNSHEFGSTDFSKIKKRAHIFELDTNGVVQQDWYPSTYNEDTGVYAIQPTSTGGWIYGTLEERGTSPFNNVWETKSKIKMLDKNFTELWSKTLTAASLGSYIPYPYIYYTLGSISKFENDWIVSSNEYNNPTKILKFNEFGDVIFQKNLFWIKDTKSKLNLIRHGAITENGSMYFMGSGAASFVSLGKYTAWCVKLDRNGCETVSDCATTEVFDLSINKERVKLSPNPAASDLEIEIKLASADIEEKVDIFIVNLNGEIVQKYIMPDYAYLATLDISKLASGVYGVQLRQRNKVLAVEKLVVVR